MVANIFNPSPGEADTTGQSNKFQVSQSYIAKFILKKKEKGEKCVGASVLQADFKLRGQKRAPDCLELKLITPGCELGIETPSSKGQSRLHHPSSGYSFCWTLHPRPHGKALEGEGPHCFLMAKKHDQQHWQGPTTLGTSHQASTRFHQIPKH